MCVTSDLQAPTSASQLAGLQANTTATRGDFSSVLCYCYWCLVGRKWAGALTGQNSCSWFLRDAYAPVICYWTMIFSHFAKSVCWTEIQELELESGLQGKVSWGFCRTLTKVMDWWTALPGMCVSRLGLPPGTRKIPLILFSSENWRWVVFKVECLPHFLHTWIK